MIQFNLLPDVKKEYVKVKRTKRLITSVSLLSSIVAIVIVGIMFSVVNIAQKEHIADLTSDIEKITQEIQSTEDLDKILTVQNQLSILPSLHAGKPETSRIFEYIRFFSPELVKVGTFNLDVSGNALTLAGTADSIATINRLVDNIKSVRYTIVGQEGELEQPFEGVTTSLGADNESATFQIRMSYDPTIFDNTNEIQMSIAGQQISTEEQAAQ